MTDFPGRGRMVFRRLKHTLGGAVTAMTPVELGRDIINAKKEMKGDTKKVSIINPTYLMLQGLAAVVGATVGTVYEVYTRPESNVDAQALLKGHSSSHLGWRGDIRK